MADIHILRNHTLGLAGARNVAFEWAEQVEQEFEMECVYAEGASEDELSFKRSGVNGTLLVTSDQFELSVKLGFLFGAFKDKIEAEIVQNLDQLLKPASASKATAKAGVKKK